MDSETKTMPAYAYVGRRPCGHVRAGVVDDPTRPTWVASYVQQMATCGLQVERVEATDANLTLERCDECDPPALVWYQHPLPLFEEMT